MYKEELFIIIELLMKTYNECKLIFFNKRVHSASVSSALVWSGLLSLFLMLFCVLSLKDKCQIRKLTVNNQLQHQRNFSSV